jgi:hypothetical protein
MGAMIYVDSYSFFLALAYFLIVFISGFQIGRILYYGHNILHYQFIFLCYCFVWGVLRTIFWLFLPWEPFHELILQGLSAVIQVATFSYLVLFYAEISYKAGGQWHQLRKRTYFIYVLCNVLFLLCLSVLIALAILFGAKHPTVENGAVIFVSIIYFLLAIFLGYYGYKMFRVVSSSKVLMSTVFLQRRGGTKIAIVTATLILIFTSRAVRDFVAAFHIGVIDIDNPHDEIWRQIIIFLMLFIWEIIPTILVILFFWHIPKTTVSIPPPRPFLYQYQTECPSESETRPPPFSAARHEPSLSFQTSDGSKTSHSLNASTRLLVDTFGPQTRYGSDAAFKYVPYNTSSFLQNVNPSINTADEYQEAKQ